MSKYDMLVAIIKWVAGAGDSVVPVLYDLSEKLGDREVLTEFKKFLRHEPCWVDQVAQSILEFVGTVMVPATTNEFVAKTRFVANTERNAPVRISYIGDNFKAWFLNGDGKTEDPISEQTLRYHKLRQSSVDGPIITELGGEAKAETTLSEMFSLMEKQKHGEGGVLLNNGCANIFYVRDLAGVLRAVFVFWCGGGWRVGAFSVEGPRRWVGGRQVFSRNSDLRSSEPSAPAPSSPSATTA